MLDGMGNCLLGLVYGTQKVIGGWTGPGVGGLTCQEGRAKNRQLRLGSQIWTERLSFS